MYLAPFHDADPGKPASQNSDPGTLSQVVLPIFRTHWLRLACGFIALVTVDFLQLLIPRLVKSAVDALSSGVATSLFLLKLSGAVMLVAVSVALLRFLWRFLIIGFSRILEMKLRNRLF